jgi:hypothetical protein
MTLAASQRHTDIIMMQSSGTHSLSVQAHVGFGCEECVNFTAAEPRPKNATKTWSKALYDQWGVPLH